MSANTAESFNLEEPSNLPLRKSRGRIMEGLCMVLSLIGVAVLLIILGYIVYKGVGAINWNFFTKAPAPVGETGGGVGNAIQGTLIIVGLAACIALPVGIGTGTWLAQFGRGVIADIVRTITDILTGVPSIIIGILAWQLVVVPMHSFSAWAGALALSVIMLPTIVRTTEEILRLVPRDYTEAALALGAPRWRTVLAIIYPAAAGGIITGVMLAIARAAGESAPLLFTAFGNTYYNSDPSKPTAALPVQIFQYATSPYDDWHQQAWGAALVLVFLILILSILTRVATSRGPK